MADQRYILDAVWAARLPKMWRWMRNLRVTGAASFKNTEDSCAIAFPQAQGDDASAGVFVIEAKLTSRDGTDPTLYAWSQARRKTAGDWEVITGGRTGATDDVPAIDVVARGDLTNQFVVMARGSYKDADPKAAPCWYIIEAPVVVMIPVLLTKTSGSIGSKTTASSWVYTVKDVQSNTIITGASPSISRPNGTLGEASFGWGYYPPDGSDFVLLYAAEIRGTGGCS